MASSYPLSAVALHGLAESPESLDRMIARVRHAMAAPDVDWVFPRAPQRPVSILEGRLAHAWYDIRAYDRSLMDEAGIDAAAEAVALSVKAERDRGRHVVLVGFSQGGALALHVGLRMGSAVAGIVALAAALPLPERVEAARLDSPPIFLGHGRFDSVVPHDLGLQTLRLLREKGYEAEWHSYWCAHSLTARFLRDVRRWLPRATGAERIAAGNRGLARLFWPTPARPA